MSFQPNSNRDKRVSKLSRESEKLRQEITELEDALILHSRCQVEDDTSMRIRGMIRREVGGSRWEHGGEGRLHTYRGNKDLTEKSRRGRQICAEDRQSIVQSQIKETGTHQTTQSEISTPQKHRLSSAVKTNKCERKAVDRTCLNGDWALDSKKTPKAIPDSNKGSLSEIRALKNKVLAKASAKVIKRKDFAPSYENKSNVSLDDGISFNENNLANRSAGKLNTDKMRKENSKNKCNNDINYSLSFLESLQEIEVHDSNMPKEFSTAKDRELQSQKRVDPKLTDGGSDVKGVDSDKSTIYVNLKGSKSYKWATETDKASFDTKQQIHTRTQRRNSVEGDCQLDIKENSKMSKNRKSQPAYETDSQFRRPENFPSEKRPSPLDFPLLFGSVHKTLDVHSQGARGNDYVTLCERSLSSNHNQTEDVNTGGDKGLSSSGNARSLPPTKQRIIICDEEVQSWLENLGLQDVDNYVTLFSDHQMDMSTVKLLTAGRLREMGIHALGPIMKIMKGVQVLNRDLSLREDVCYEDTLEDVKGSENEISNDIGDFSYGENKHDENDGLGNSSETVQETFQNQKYAMAPTSLIWKKATDKAEFVNLDDRTRAVDVKIPLAVSIKQKTKHSEKEKKGTPSSSKSDKKKKKSADVLNSKVVKKPPVKDNEENLLAGEKYRGKKKQEDIKIRSDRTRRSRQHQLRDEMAARHINRRSSSLEGKVSPSTSQQMPLNKTFSDIQNQQDEVMSGFPQCVEEFLNTKPLASRGNTGETATSTSAREEVAVMELLDTKNLDRAVEKLTDGKESLNLSIVRQLKQQLQHIEQHLVQNMEEACEENSQGKSQEEMKQHNKECNGDSVRTSARERRRQRTTKQFSTIHQGNYDTVQDYLIVGGIASHRKPKNDNSGIGDNVDTRTAIKTKKSKSKNPSIEPPRTTQIQEDFGADKEPELSLDGRKEWEGCSLNRDNAPTNIETQILNIDNIHSKKASRPTELLPRRKFTMTQEYLRKVEIDKKDISFESKDLLGDGAFSQVYKGTYQGSKVAIKQLKTSLTPNDKNYFSAEVSLLQELCHPHVVMLLGVCTAYTCPVLVLEYLQGGNLHTRIHSSNLPSFGKDEFCPISRDIASGICYLHQHQPPVLHLDLKSRNVLLDLDYRAKVADFGFSKWKVESDIHVSRSSKLKLPYRSPAWMAPELLSAGEITPKADVYSFAVVLWEMLAREDPYKECSTYQILERVRACQRPSIPYGCPPDLTRLLQRCWEQNPCVRPTLKEILLELDNVSSCDEWITCFEEPNRNIDSTEANMSQKSLCMVEAKETMRNDVIVSSSVRKATKTKTFVIDNRDSARLDDHDVMADKKRDAREYESGDLCGHSSNDKSTETVYHEDKRRVNGNNSSNTIESHSSLAPLLQSHSPRISHNEANDYGCIDLDAEPEPEHKGIDNQTLSKLRQSAITPNIFLRSFQHESEEPITTQKLLDSTHETQKLDELLHKYPWPRDFVMKYSPTSSSGEDSRKLLPLRQSLDKPKKPTKYLKAKRTPMSLSENFGIHVDCNFSYPSVNKVDSRRTIEMSQGDTDHTLSENPVVDTSVSSTHNTKSSHISSSEPRYAQNPGKSEEASQSPLLSKSQGYEICHISSHDLNIPSEPLNDPSFDTHDAPNKPSGISSPSKNFSDEKNQVVQSLCGFHSISDASFSPEYFVQEKQINELNSSLQANDHQPDYAAVSSFEEVFTQPDSSRNEICNTEVTRLNLDECCSSVSVDMSADSLSLSVSDGTDSVDFSKGEAKLLSCIPGLPNPTKGTPKSAGENPDESTLCTLLVKNNSDFCMGTNAHGNVRESFFLFNDFHLNLNKLNDSDSDTESKRNNIPLLNHATNGTKQRSGGQRSHLIDQQSIQKTPSNKTEDVGFRVANHPLGSKMNKALKDSIHLVRKDENKNSLNTPPPTPPLCPSPMSHQIKRNPRNHSNPRNPRNHSNPIGSGLPIKSASTKPEVQSHPRFSVEPSLLLQQRNNLKSVLPEELTPMNETSFGRSMPSVASILKKAMDGRRLAMGDNQESQEGMTTPDASWSIQD